MKLPGRPNVYEIEPGVDGRLIVQTLTSSSSLQLRLSLYDGQGNLLVQSDGQSSGRWTPRSTSTSQPAPTSSKCRAFPARELTRSRRH